MEVLDFLIVFLALKILDRLNTDKDHQKLLDGLKVGAGLDYVPPENGRPDLRVVK